MPLWLIQTIAFSQIIALYWLAGPANIRLIYLSFLAKNRQWVDENPSFQQQYGKPRYAIWLSYLMGLGWFVILMQSLFMGDSRLGLIGSLIAPVFPWLALHCIYACIEYYRVCKKIPLPSRRSTSLGRRTLRDFINPLWAYAAWLSIAIVIGVYVTAFHRGDIAVELFAARMIGLTIALAIGTSTLFYAMYRKKQPIDEAWGASYRKIEVIGNIFVLYVFVLIGVLRILQDLFSISLLADVTFFAGMSLMVQVCGLYCINHPSVKKLLSENF